VTIVQKSQFDSDWRVRGTVL